MAIGRETPLEMRYSDILIKSTKLIAHAITKVAGKVAEGAYPDSDMRVPLWVWLHFNDDPATRLTTFGGRHIMFWKAGLNA
jgi:hypothetical protein